VAAIERQRAPQQADRGRGLLVVEHLDVGQPGGVVDRDVDVLPAGAAGALSGPAVARDPVPGAALDPAELLTSMWISSPAWRRS
jgi:hypothetical protein